MKLAQAIVAGVPRIVQADGDGLVALDCDGDLSGLIKRGRTPHVIPALHTDFDARDVRLASPLQPGKVVGIGLNYRDHVREAGLDVPKRPVVFAKFPSAVVGPEDPVVIDRSLTERVDWEGELAVVIGARLRRVCPGDALNYVFGYTIGNDISARDAQFADGQWVRGKSFDTFCPLGPVVVTREEVPEPQDLALLTRVNGETVQASSTREMIFSVAELLAYCGQAFTLDPGDVVLTGTPWGCGEFREPRRSLRCGDVVEVEIEGIGVLRNPVVEVAQDA